MGGSYKIKLNWRWGMIGNKKTPRYEVFLVPETGLELGIGVCL